MMTKTRRTRMGDNNNKVDDNNFSALGLYKILGVLARASRK